MVGGIALHVVYYVKPIVMYRYIYLYIGIHASRDNSQTLRSYDDRALPFYFFISLIY